MGPVVLRKKKRRITRPFLGLGSQSPTSVRICFLGLLMMVASVFADGLGLGSSPGLGPGQVVGVAAGFVVAVLGFMGATSR